MKFKGMSISNKGLFGATAAAAMIMVTTLSLAGCGSSGSTTPAVIGGTLSYHYDLLTAKESLPVGVSYINYYGNQNNFNISCPKAKEIELHNVPEGTTRMDAVYYNSNNEVVGFGINTFSSVVKGQDQEIANPSFITKEDLPDNLTLSIAPSKSIARVGNQQTFTVSYTFVDEKAGISLTEDIKNSENLVLTSSNQEVANFSDTLVPNKIEAKSMGTTQIIAAYNFYGETITSEADTFSVVDGEVTNLVVHPQKEDTMRNLESVIIVNPYCFRNRKIVEIGTEELFASLNCAYKSCQFVADATYTKDGQSFTFTNMPAKWTVSNNSIDEETKEKINPFTIDQDGLVSVTIPSIPINLSHKETATAVFQDPTVNDATVFSASTDVLSTQINANFTCYSVADPNTPLGNQVLMSVAPNGPYPNTITLARILLTLFFTTKNDGYPLATLDLSSNEELSLSFKNFSTDPYILPTEEVLNTINNKTITAVSLGDGVSTACLIFEYANCKSAVDSHNSVHFLNSDTLI